MTKRLVLVITVVLLGSPAAEAQSRPVGAAEHAAQGEREAGVTGLDGRAEPGGAVARTVEAEHVAALDPELVDLARARAHAIASRQQALVPRLAVQSLVAAVLVAGMASLEGALIVGLGDASGCGTFCIPEGVFIGIGAFLTPVVFSALVLASVVGIGDVMGGRGNMLGATLGYILGAVLGGAVIAAGAAIGHSAGLSNDSADGLLAGSIALAGVLGAAGCILGYTVWDQDQQSHSDEPDFLPVASITPEGVLLGGAGRF